MLTNTKARYLLQLQINRRWCKNIRKYSSALLKFVPDHQPVKDEDVVRLQEFISKSSRLLVITGAGVSTESGIPDYRSEGVGLYSRTNSRRPIQYKEFLENLSIRRRFWARSYIGWPFFSNVQPNACHQTLSKWEQKGRIYAIVTQNVDGLHLKSGSRNVVELHGTAFRVRCLDCDNMIERKQFQEVLAKLNPEIKLAAVNHTIRPDGDIDITDERVNNFQFPKCSVCQGILKPDIIFFGESVPSKTMETVYGLVEECDSVLVLGSSLTVYSGYRLLLKASELNKPSAIVNIGPTRADHLCPLHIEARCGEILPQLLTRI